MIYSTLKPPYIDKILYYEIRLVNYIDMKVKEIIPDAILKYKGGY